MINSLTKIYNHHQLNLSSHITSTHYLNSPSQSTLSTHPIDLPPIVTQVQEQIGSVFQFALAMDAITAQPYRRQKLREMGVEREEAGVERGEFEVEKEGVNMNRKESELENVQEEENEKEEEEDRDESFFPLLSDLTPLKSHSGGCGDGTNGSPAHKRDKQDKVPYFSNVMCEEPVVGTVGDVIYNGGVGEGSNDLGSAVDGASNSGGRDRDGSHGRGDGDIPLVREVSW